MGSLKYMEGEIKKRPGLYNRVSNADNGIAVADAINGIGAIAIDSDWGPLNTVTKFTGSNMAYDLVTAYGTSTGALTAQAFLSGGLQTLYVCRIGTGGTAASATLSTAITISAKYPGTRTFSLTVRDSITDTGKKELLVLEDATLLQKIVFASTAQDLADAITSSNSSYITATVEDGKGTTNITNVSGTAMTGGANPNVTNADYSTGFSAFEPYEYNVLTCDNNTLAVSTLMANYAEKAEALGKRIIAVTGINDSAAFDTKCDNAKSFNAANFVYCGSGYIDREGNEIGKNEGDAKANAIMAGYIASVSSKNSVVHQQITGAVDVITKYSNSDYVTAIESGLVLLSVGSNGQVWFDSGVNTLIYPSVEQDEGWKKIKRVKTRYELFDRMDRTLEPFIGQINTNDSDVVLQIGQKVIDTMVQEGKLISGTITLNTTSADSAWFDIEVIDPDTLEKIYLHYKFRYSQTA